MYTVKELIEALQKCPEDYNVMIYTKPGEGPQIKSIGIDPTAKVVDLFTE